MKWLSERRNNSRTQQDIQGADYIFSSWHIKLEAASFRDCYRAYHKAPQRKLTSLSNLFRHHWIIALKL